MRCSALALIVLMTPSANATETLRIRVEGQVPAVTIRGAALGFGDDVDAPTFQPLGADEAAATIVEDKLTLNDNPVTGQSVRLRSLDSAPLVIGKLELRGDVVVRRGAGGLEVVNVLPLEDYLVGVLGSEMPKHFPLEALKAQAVAARTYALRKKIGAYDEPVHVGNTVLHQVYGGLKREDPRTRIAVEATRGEILTYELEPIEAYFHASCGGRTESGLHALSRDLPYLKPVSCPCGELRHSRWTVQLPAAELQKALGVEAPDKLRVIQRSDTGRALRIALGSGATVDGAVFRRRLGYGRLRSLAFSVSANSSDGFQIQGRGHGHGAGLCQWGAKVNADQGWSYGEILSHYYPGTELQKLY